MASINFTEKFDVITSSPSTGAWTSIDLSSLGVPNNAVVCVLCLHNTDGTTNNIGVREVGSNLSRYVNLHEPESGGSTQVVMHVQSDSTASIQYVTEDSGASFILLGYYGSTISYTEALTLHTPTTTTWELTTVDQANCVTEFSCQNTQAAANVYVGVGKSAAPFARYVQLNEAEGGGVESFTSLAKSDNNSEVNIISTTTGGKLLELGSFSDNVDLVEANLTITPTSDGVWRTLTQLPYADCVALPVCIHQSTGKEKLAGARSGGSSVSRLWTPHEAEGGGFVGEIIPTLLSATGTYQVYYGDVSACTFRMFGYLIFGPPTIALNTADETDFESNFTPSLEFTGTEAEENDLKYEIAIGEEPPGWVDLEAPVGYNYGVAFDHSNGDIYVGRSGSPYNVRKYTASTDSWANLPGTHPTSNPSGRAVTVNENNGEVWFSGYNCNGCHKYDPTDDSYTAYSFPTTRDVQGMYCDNSNGKVWIACNYDIYYYNPGTDAVIDLNVTSRDYEDIGIYEATGQLWVATTNSGVFTAPSGSSTLTEITDSPHKNLRFLTINQDNGDVWIGDVSGDVWKYTIASGEFTENSTYSRSGSQFVSADYDPDSDILYACFYTDAVNLVESFFPPLISQASDASPTTAFLNTVTGADTTPFNSGEKISFTVQTVDELDPNSTYYWKARSISTLYTGSWSEIREFYTGESTSFYEITGYDIPWSAGLNTESGEYLTTGVDPTHLPAASGIFELTGFNVADEINADSTSYGITGSQATLTVAKVPYSAKCIILDIESNWGDASYFKLNKMSFYLKGELVAILYEDITEYNTNYYTSWTLGGSISDTDPGIDPLYQPISLCPFPNRHTVNFASAISFDRISVINGTGTSGVKDCIIRISDDVQTSTTYNQSVSNETILLDGLLAQDVDQNGIDVNLEDHFPCESGTFALETPVETTLVEEGWLGTYAKRIKITIDMYQLSTGNALVHWPIPVMLNSSCGASDQDLTGIFSDVGSDYLKIAVTDYGGVHQLFVDVAHWDGTAEDAAIYVSRDDFKLLKDSGKGFIYIYYDDTQPDNTDHIGMSGSAVAQNVYNDEFALVYHMSQDPTGGTGCIKDSTQHENHGTPHGSMTAGDLVDGLCGKALNFDGVDDYIEVGGDPDHFSYLTDSGGGFEMTIVAKQDVANQSETLLSNANDNADIGFEVSYEYSATTTGDIKFAAYKADTDHLLAKKTYSTFFPSTPAWHVTRVYTVSTYLYFYWNGYNRSASSIAPTFSEWASGSPSKQLRIGADNGTDTGTPTQPFDGSISEVWIHTTYQDYTIFPEQLFQDEILTYSQPELLNPSILDCTSGGYDITGSAITMEYTGWLRGTPTTPWKKRIKVAIYPNIVGYAGYEWEHYPVPIFLRDSAGKNDEDVTAIFDELGSSSKKIAITLEDGLTQLYGEIVSWDSTNEFAMLYVSKSDFVLYEDVIKYIYIYFDSDQPDNTSFIGTAGDTAAANVWDSTFKLVYHFQQDPTGGTECILDSTSNQVNGTPHGSMTSGDLVDGFLGKCLEFDGVDDYIEIEAAADYFDFVQTTFHYLCEIVDRPDVNRERDVLIGNACDIDVTGFMVMRENDATYGLATYRGAVFKGDNIVPVSDGHAPNYSIPETEGWTIWNNSGVGGGTGQHFYVSGSFIGGSLSWYDYGEESDYAVWIGACNDNGSVFQPYKGKINEIRFSDYYRDAEYKELTGPALLDNILDYYPMEYFSQTMDAQPGTYVLSGSDVSLGEKINVDPGSYLVTGTAISFEKKMPADSVLYSITGTATSKRFTAESGDYSISGDILQPHFYVDPGGYLLTGSMVHEHFKIEADPGNYAITIFDLPEFIVAEKTSYDLTGSWVDLSVPLRLSADSGEHLITGAEIALNKTLNPDQGAYSLNGTELAFSVCLSAGNGVYSLVGIDTSHRILVESGEYSLTGVDSGKRIAIESGGYLLTGDSLFQNYPIIADLGEYALTGIDTLDGISADPGSYSLTDSGTVLGIGFSVLPGEYNHIGTITPRLYTKTGIYNILGIDNVLAHDYKVINDGLVFYYFTLTGAEDGVEDIEIPIISFQATLRSGSPTFLSVQIPDMSFASAITERLNGTLQVDLAYKLIDGSISQRENIVEANLEDIRVYKRDNSYLISLSGHKQKTHFKKAIVLHGQSLKIKENGIAQYDFPEPNLYLSPGDDLTVDDDTFEVGIINYFVSSENSNMKVIAAA